MSLLLLFNTAVDQSLAPNGISSSIALGHPLLSSSGAITPTGITSSIALGVPQAVIDVLVISPSGTPSSVALGQPTLSSLATIHPSGISTTLRLGTPTIQGMLKILSAPGISSSIVFGSATISLPIASRTISPSGIPSRHAIGFPQFVFNVLPAIIYLGVQPVGTITLTVQSSSIIEISALPMAAIQVRVNQR